MTDQSMKAYDNFEEAVLKYLIPLVIGCAAIAIGAEIFSWTGIEGVDKPTLEVGVLSAMIFVHLLIPKNVLTALWMGVQSGFLVGAQSDVGISLLGGVILLLGTGISLMYFFAAVRLNIDRHFTVERFVILWTAFAMFASVAEKFA